MKKLSGLLISLAIILFLYSRLDVKGIMGALSNLDAFYLTGCFLLFLPQTVIMAYRWKVICQPYYRSDMKESFSLVLSGQAMNLFLPSKMGDIAKAAFLHDHSTLGWRQGIDFVILEKGLDLAALSGWLMIGFLAGPITGKLELSVFFLGMAVIMIIGLIYSGKLGNGDKVNELLSRLNFRLGETVGGLLKGGVTLKKDLSQNGLFIKIVLLSVFLWFLHLGQFYLFFNSLGINDLSAITVFTLIPMGIFFGLLPFTFSGIGTRDAAFIYLFRAWVSPEKMALVGMFSLVRYLVPGLLGLPFIGKNLTSLKLNRKKIKE